MFVRAGVAATRSPPGNVSVKASVVIPPLVALLVIVSVIVLTPVPTLVEKLFADFLDTTDRAPKKRERDDFSY